MDIISIMLLIIILYDNTQKKGRSIVIFVMKDFSFLFEESCSVLLEMMTPQGGLLLCHFSKFKNVGGFSDVSKCKV